MSSNKGYSQLTDMKEGWNIGYNRDFCHVSGICVFHKHIIQHICPRKLVSLMISLHCSMVHGQEDGNHLLRVGSMVLHTVGQLLPHQIQTGKFHTRDYIYPVMWSNFILRMVYWIFNLSAASVSVILLLWIPIIKIRNLSAANLSSFCSSMNK